MKLGSENFIADIADIIRSNLKDASNTELINLSKSSFYFRNFAQTKDLYSVVHAECVTRYNLRKIEEEIVEALKNVYSAHGIMNESPFSKVRVSRWLIKLLFNNYL